MLHLAMLPAKQV